MKKILYLKLKILAKLVLVKYKPKIVGVTGSVGKTSTKEAIYNVISRDFRVERSIGNYNNELGMPLTILRHYNSPGKNIFGWLILFLKVLGMLIIRDNNYPEVLVLEMSADRPGDIKYLTSIAPPDIAVITAIGPSHIEFFGSIKNILKEKSSILKKLGKDGWAILNQDDKYLADLVDRPRYQLKTFGQSENGDVQVADIKISHYQDKYGTSFKLRYQGSSTPMFLPMVLGWQHAQAAAAACAVGLALGMNIVNIGKRLAEYKPAPGRTNLLEGIKHTWIIDDTYNSSPQSSVVALDILAQMPAEGRRIAIFGDMLELGDMTESGHREVGKKVAELKIDYLFLFGARARDIGRGAKQAGMNEDKIFSFPSVIKSGPYVQDRIKEGDVVLVKGSRGAKMEQMVYEIMARPWEADEVLVSEVSK